MSLIDELSAALHGTAARLPLPALRAGATDLRAGLDRLTQAVLAGAALPTAEQSSARPALGRPGTARLAAAIAHAETAIGLLHRAQDEVWTYLAAVGRLDPPGHTEPVEPFLAAPRGASTLADSLSDSWWTRRVDELYPEAPAKRTPPAGSAGELLRRLVVAVGEDHLDELHPELRTVNASTGLGLSGAASRHLARLVEDLLERTPAPTDHEALTARLDLRRLVPALEPTVPAEILSRVCHVDPQPPDKRHERGPANPVDLAVAAGVLVALLLVVLRRDPKTLDEPEPVEEVAVR